MAFVEGVLSGIVANIVYSIAHGSLLKLNGRISKYFDLDRFIDRSFALAFEKAYGDVVQKFITRGRHTSEFAEFANFMSSSPDLLVPILYDKFVYGRLLQRKRIIELYCDSRDMGRATDESGYDYLLDQLSSLFEEALLQRSRGSSVVIYRQIEEISKKIDRINSIFQEFEEKVSLKLDSQTQIFIDEYMKYVQSDFSRFRHFGFPSHMRPKQDLEVAFIPLSFKSVLSQEDRLINGILGESSARVNSRISASEVLSEIPILAIVGQAGSGKTTLLQWVATHQAPGADSVAQGMGQSIPFLIPLRRLDQVSQSGAIAVDRLFQHATDRDVFDLRSPYAIERKILKARKAILLFDGIDELSPRKRAEFWSSLNSLRAEYPGNRMVVTSRPIAGVHLGDGTRLRAEGTAHDDYLQAVRENWVVPEGTYELIVDKMGVEEIFNFIDGWHASLDVNALESQGFIKEPTNYASVLKDKVEDSGKDLIELCETPLLCSMLCALHFYNDGKIPDDRPQLFRECVSIMVATRDAAREIKYQKVLDELTEPQKIDIIQSIAINMQASFFDAGKDSRMEVPKDKVLAWIERIKGNIHGWDAGRKVDARELLRFLIERSSVIREPAGGYIDFIHRSFMEYLTASAWPISGRDVRELAIKVQSDQWHDTLRFAANTVTGGSRFAGELIQELWVISKEPSSTRYMKFIIDIICDIYRFVPQKPRAIDVVMNEVVAYLLPLSEGSIHNIKKLDFSLVRDRLAYSHVGSWKGRERARAAKLLLQHREYDILNEGYFKDSDEDVIMSCNWAGIPMFKHGALKRRIRSGEFSGARLEKLFINDDRDYGIVKYSSEFSINIDRANFELDKVGRKFDRINIMLSGGSKPLNVDVSAHTVAIFADVLDLERIRSVFEQANEIVLIGVKSVRGKVSRRRSWNIRLRACNPWIEGKLRSALGEGDVHLVRDPHPIELLD